MVSSASPLSFFSSPPHLKHLLLVDRYPEAGAGLSFVTQDFLFPAPYHLPHLSLGSALSSAPPHLRLGGFDFFGGVLCVLFVTFYYERFSSLWKPRGHNSFPHSAISSYELMAKPFCSTSSAPTPPTPPPSYAILGPFG